MATMKGTVLLDGGAITLADDTNDSFTHYADQGKGGVRSVANMDALYAIKSKRREVGMVVYVVSEESYYKLEGGLTNEFWVPFFAGSDEGAILELEQAVKDRDVMYGINLRHTSFWTAAGMDLKYKDAETSIAANRPFVGVPRTSGSVNASQSGTTVTAVSATSVFSNADMGRRIIFANGMDAVIVGVTIPVGLTPVVSVTVDRPQTVTSQTYKIVASGQCWVQIGDSVSESNKLSLIARLYKTYGVGGFLIGPFSDTTIARTHSFLISGGVTALANAFDFSPAGICWLAPVGGVMEGWVSAKYADGYNDRKQIFDTAQYKLKTNCMTFVCERKAGVTVKIEGKLNENTAQSDGWILMADNVDCGVGAEDLFWKTVFHAMGNSWHYRVTVLTDTSGTGIRVSGFYTENRDTPGFTYVSWNTGGSKLSDFDNVTLSAMKCWNWILRISAIGHEFRDYEVDSDGNPDGQVPDLPTILPLWRQKWNDAGVRATHFWFGGYPNQRNTGYWESNVYRDVAIQFNDPWMNAQSRFRVFDESSAVGIMADGDTVHANDKGDRIIGDVIDATFQLTEGPWTNEGRDIDSNYGNFHRLCIDDEDVEYAIQASKSGPMNNAVKMLTTGFGVWATIPAIGTVGFTVQMFIEVPIANPGSTISLFGIYPSESTSNAAGMITCIIDTGGRLSISIRNAENTASSTYRLGGAATTPGDFIKSYGGKSGWLTFQIDPSKEHPQVWFGTKRVNDDCLPGFAAASTGSNPRITDPISVNGVSFNLAVSTTHFIRACAIWTGVPSWDGELKRNVQRNKIGGMGATTPTAYWFASTGAGRYVVDISGNKRHAFMRNTSVGSLFNIGDGITTGLSWENPTGIRTKFYLTGTSAAGSSGVGSTGMIARQGEDIIVNMTGVMGGIALPSVTDPRLPSIRVFGYSAQGWKLVQATATVQIATGAGNAIGTNITTAGLTGGLSATDRHACIEVMPYSDDLWIAPTFPSGAQVLVSSGSPLVGEPTSGITGARVASFLILGGLQSFGTTYNPWAVIPAISNAGFTMAWTGALPAANPSATTYLCAVTATRSLSNTGGSLYITLTTTGALNISARSSDNGSSRAWRLDNFVSNFYSKVGRIVIRFNPASTTPEVWVEDIRVDGTGNMAWTVSDVGASPPAMSAAGLLGTNLMIGCVYPCYQFTLWSGVLPDAEMADNQRNGVSRGATAPICYYTFNENQGRKLFDRSGNLRDAILLDSSTNFGNNSGNGITTGVRWLNRVIPKYHTYALTANNAGDMVLRTGEVFISDASARQYTRTPDVADLCARVTIFGKGAGGYEVNLPTGHSAFLSGTDGTGSNATSTGLKITSNAALKTVLEMSVWSIDGSGNITWVIHNGHTGMVLT